MQTLKELLEIQWNGDQKMVDHCLKSSVYIQSGDTFILVGDRKPRIESDMWYDDETVGPDKSFDNFREYNMRYKPFKLRDNARFVTTGYWSDRTGGKLLAFTIDKGDTRPATQEEIDLANAALDEVRKDYEKRLVSYWKRYSDKVSARGYWVNR